MIIMDRERPMSTHRPMLTNSYIKHQQNYSTDTDVQQCRPLSNTATQYQSCNSSKLQSGSRSACFTVTGAYLTVMPNFAIEVTKIKQKRFILN